MWIWIFYFIYLSNFFIFIISLIPRLIRKNVKFLKLELNIRNIRTPDKKYLFTIGNLGWFISILNPDSKNQKKKRSKKKYLKKIKSPSSTTFYSQNLKGMRSARRRNQRPSSVSSESDSSDSTSLQGKSQKSNEI